MAIGHPARPMGRAAARPLQGRAERADRLTVQGDRGRPGSPFPVHPHMLRHACGFALANGRHDTRAIQEWLGTANIQHTTRYTELTHRFREFWQREN